MPLFDLFVKFTGSCFPQYEKIGLEPNKDIIEGIDEDFNNSVNEKYTVKRELNEQLKETAWSFVIHYIDTLVLFKLRQVSKRFRNMINNKHIWKYRFIGYFGDLPEINDIFFIERRKVIDKRSQILLVNQNFCTRHGDNNEITVRLLEALKESDGIPRTVSIENSLYNLKRGKYIKVCKELIKTKRFISIDYN
jgi:hypothetical protein